MLVLCVLVLTITWLVSTASLSLQREAITMLTNLIVVVGLYTFAGNSGVMSFGHISFMAIGAYVAALVSIPEIQKGVLLPDLPTWLASLELGPTMTLVVAGLSAAVFGGLISIPLMRLSGISAALSMFAVLLIVQVVATNWEDVTRGKQTMLGVPTNIGLWDACWLAIGAIALSYGFQRSRVALRLRATRDDAYAAEALGINAVADRRIALVLSAFIVGVAGFVFAQTIGSFSPSAFYVSLTFLTIAMLVVGGVRSLTGAVIGTLAVSIFAEILRHVEEGVDIGPLSLSGRPGLREVGLACGLIIVLIFRPRGITNGREVPWPWAKRADGLAKPDPQVLTSQEAAR
jgi:branched-chain amino acid transport system permease protein